MRRFSERDELWSGKANRDSYECAERVRSVYIDHRDGKAVSTTVICAAWFASWEELVDHVAAAHKLTYKEIRELPLTDSEGIGPP